jgi:hypothetical protein
MSQTSLRVDSLLVPLRHTMNHEGVSKVVNAGTTAASVSVHASEADDPPKQLSRSHAAVASPGVAKQSGVRICGGSGFSTTDKIVVNDCYRAR